jgi:hypothetical protein
MSIHRRTPASETMLCHGTETHCHQCRRWNTGPQANASRHFFRFIVLLLETIGARISLATRLPNPRTAAQGAEPQERRTSPCSRRQSARRGPPHLPSRRRITATPWRYSEVYLNFASYCNLRRRKKHDSVFPPFTINLHSRLSQSQTSPNLTKYYG